MSIANYELSIFFLHLRHDRDRMCVKEVTTWNQCMNGLPK
nr:MAG TPA: hypothetical protein [Caudoviricetes sp.]